MFSKYKIVKKNSHIVHDPSIHINFAYGDNNSEVKRSWVLMKYMQSGFTLYKDTILLHAERDSQGFICVKRFHCYQVFIILFIETCAWKLFAKFLWTIPECCNIVIFYFLQKWHKKSILSRKQVMHSTHLRISRFIHDMLIKRIRISILKKSTPSLIL